MDIEAAGRRGIAVSNVPVYGTESVAHYGFSAAPDNPLFSAKNIAIATCLAWASRVAR